MSERDSRTGGVLFFNMDLMLNKHSIFITFPLILLRHTNFVFESPESNLLAEIGSGLSIGANYGRLLTSWIDHHADRNQQFGGLKYDI